MSASSSLLATWGLSVTRHAVRQLGVGLAVGATLAGGIDDALATQEDCTLEETLVFITQQFEHDDGKVEQLGSGTGFLIHESGYVLTATHVAQPEDPPADRKLVLKGAGRSREHSSYPLNLIDVAKDIALLRFPPELRDDWCYLEIGESRDLKKAQKILAYGFPLDQDITVKEGTISALAGPRQSIQMSAGVIPGMSGGPVLNQGSHAVGVIVGGVPPYSSMTFFIPVHYAQVLLDIPPAHRPRSLPTLRAIIPVAILAVLALVMALWMLARRAPRSDEIASIRTNMDGMRDEFERRLAELAQYPNSRDPLARVATLPLEETAKALVDEALRAVEAGRLADAAMFLTQAQEAQGAGTR